MNHLLRSFLPGLLATLLLGLAVPSTARAGSRGVRAEKIWSGYVKDVTLLDKAPARSFITDARTFEELWKAWKLGDRAPDVDFKTDLVHIMTNRGNLLTFGGAFLGMDGDFIFIAYPKEATERGFGYVIFTTKRDGIKTLGKWSLDGKELPEPSQPTPLKAEKTWSGTVMDRDLLKKKDARSGFYILDAKTFEELWKAWKLGDKVPEIDFRNEIALVISGAPGVTIHPSLHEKGDLGWYFSIPFPSDKPGFGYMIITVKKDGIKTIANKWSVDGKELPGPKDKDLKAEKTWSGNVPDLNLLKKKEAPHGTYITDAKTFEELWKAWKLGDKVPEIDFKREIALVFAHPQSRVSINPFLDDKGDLFWSYNITPEEKPGFGYVIYTVKRDGVKTVDGKPLKE